MKAPSPAAAALTIRPAQVDDAERLADIHLLTWQATYRGLLSEHYLNGLLEGVQRRAVALAEAIAHQTMSVLVVEQGGQLVAWASFGSSRDADALPSTGELRAINVLPQVWSQGMGRRLWQQVRQELAGAGFSQATVWVIQGNQRGRGFYESLGFVQEPQTAVTVMERNEPLPLIRYQVRL